MPEPAQPKEYLNSTEMLRELRINHLLFAWILHVGKFEMIKVGKRVFFTQKSLAQAKLYLHMHDPEGKFRVGAKAEGRLKMADLFCE